MIIDKVLPYWKEEEKQLLEEIDQEKTNKLLEAIRTHTPQEVANMYIDAVGILDQKSTELKKRVEARYIKATSKKGLLTDIEEIVNAIEKEDYLEDIRERTRTLDIMTSIGLKDDEAYSLKLFLEESFTNCAIFIGRKIRVQLFALEGDTKRTEAAKAIIEKRVSLWYSAPPQPYHLTHQGTETNYYYDMKPLEKNDNRIDKISQLAKIETRLNSGGKLITQITPDGLAIPIKQVFLMTIEKFTENHDPHIFISTEEYMKKRNLTDRKEAVKTLITAANNIRPTNISRTDITTDKEGKEQEVRRYSFINYLDSGHADSRGIELFLAPTFSKILSSLPVMYVPPQLCEINPHNNPNSFNFLMKLTEQKNMNFDDVNEGNIVSVKTLLKVAPSIPSYDKVMKSNRNLARIIEPFERDLDELKPTLEWEYCHSKGVPLTPQELDIMSATPTRGAGKQLYELFITLYVKVTWKNYPDQTARKERKEQKKAEQAAKNTASKRGRKASNKKSTAKN